MTLGPGSSWPSAERIEQAASKIDAVFLGTPQYRSVALSQLAGCEVVLKVETVNPFVQGPGGKLASRHAARPSNGPRLRVGGQLRPGVGVCGRYSTDFKPVKYFAAVALWYLLLTMIWHLIQGRIAIARALAMRPALMLFDEATRALDPETVGEVLKVMKELARDGMTLICVTHEMGFAREAADRVMMMDGGLILEEGPPDEVFTNPTHPRCREFLSKTI